MEPPQHGVAAGNGSWASGTGDQDGEHAETEWQRKLADRAMSAIRGAHFPFLLALDEPPEQGLIELCRRVFGEWELTAKLLQEITDATPEELEEKRKSETERLARLEEDRQRKVAEACERGERAPGP